MIELSAGRKLRHAGGMMQKQEKTRSEVPSTGNDHYSPDLFLRTLIENAPNAIFSVRRDGMFIEMNTLAARALGGSPGDFVGRKMQELFPSSHADRQLESIQRVIDSNKGEVHRRPTLINGELRWFVTTIQPLPQPDGVCESALCVANDISETIERSRELQRERDFNRTILQTANCLIFALDEDASISVFNSECERLSGYSAEEVIGKNYHSIFLPREAHHEGLKNFGDWVRQNPRDSYEGPWLTKSGELKTVHWSTSAFENEETGELVAIAIGIDITQKKKDEEKLRLHAFAFENITDAVMVIEPSGKIIQWNAGAERLLGYKAEEVIGKLPSSLVSSDIADDLNREIWSHLESGQPWNGVVKGTRKDGSSVYSETSIIPLIDDSGNVIAEISVSHDITPHRELQQALTASEAHKSAVLQALPDMVFVIDYDGICLDFKAAPDEEPIVPAKEFLGKPAHEYLPVATASRILAAIRRAIDTGEMQSLEYKLDRPHRSGFYEARFVKCAERTCVAVVRNMTKRKAMEAELADTNLQLKREHQQTTEANIALRGVLQQVEAECNKIKSQVVENVDKQIAPLLEKLRRASDPRLAAIVRQVEYELREITSPFTRNLINHADNLTRRELQVAKMIRAGLRSKEIAEILSISSRTVEKTRQNIRRKLGITHKEMNLSSHLDNILGAPRT